MKFRTIIFALLATVSITLAQDGKPPRNQEQRIAELEWKVAKLEGILTKTQGMLEDILKKLGEQPGNATDAQSTERFTIFGDVIQRTPEGSLIECKGIVKKTDTRKRAKGTIWITGLHAREGATVNGVGTATGEYSFTTVAGAPRVVDSFEWLSGSSN